MKEIWRDIKGYEGLYRISNKGRLYRKNFGVIKLQKDKDGYAIYRLSIRHVEKTAKIHRIVAEHFLGVSRLLVNHKDGIKNNNWVSNLEWVTSKQNSEHARLMGFTRRGEQVSNSKLTEKEVRQLRAEYSCGDVLQRQLALKFGVSRNHISRIILRQRWAHI